jgi:hypothetical protein
VDDNEHVVGAAKIEEADEVEDVGNPENATDVASPYKTDDE